MKHFHINIEIDETKHNWADDDTVCFVLKSAIVHLPGERLNTLPVDGELTIPALSGVSAHFTRSM